MARKEQRFHINMSFDNFLDSVIDTAEVRTTNDTEIIKTKDGKTIVLNKKLQYENKSPNRPI